MSGASWRRRGRPASWGCGCCMRRQAAAGDSTRATGTGGGGGGGGEFAPAHGHVGVVSELEPAKEEPLVTKTSHNAFTTTNLGQILTMAGVHQVAVCGLRTEECVETTARVASDFGYEVTFVTDATGTFPIPHWDAPADQTVEELLADPRTL